MRQMGASGGRVGTGEPTNWADSASAIGSSHAAHAKPQSMESTSCLIIRSDLLHDGIWRLARTRLAPPGAINCAPRSVPRDDFTREANSGTPATSMLAREWHFRVTHPVMPRQCVGAAEGLLLGAETASHLLLAGIMDGVLVTGQVVGPREDGVALLPGAGVDSIAAMRAGLAANDRTNSGAIECLRLSVALPLVLLKKRRGLEPQSAAVIGAGVGAAFSVRAHGTHWLSWSVMTRLSRAGTCGAQSGRGLVTQSRVGDEGVLLRNVDPSGHL